MLSFHKINMFHPQKRAIHLLFIQISSKQRVKWRNLLTNSLSWRQQKSIWELPSKIYKTTWIKYWVTPTEHPTLVRRAILSRLTLIDPSRLLLKSSTKWDLVAQILCRLAQWPPQKMWPPRAIMKIWIPYLTLSVKISNLVEAYWTEIVKRNIVEWDLLVIIPSLNSQQIMEPILPHRVLWMSYKTDLHPKRIEVLQLPQPTRRIYLETSLCQEFMKSKICFIMLATRNLTSYLQNMLRNWLNCHLWLCIASRIPIITPKAELLLTLSLTKLYILWLMDCQAWKLF